MKKQSNNSTGTLQSNNVVAYNKALETLHNIKSNNSDTYFNKYEFKTIKNYDVNKAFITPVSFCENSYKLVTICIVKSMYTSNKTMNYTGVKSIVESGYNDNIIEDLQQVCFITMYENTKRLINTNTSYKITFKELFQKHINCVYWDSKTNRFVKDLKYPCDTIWLACYRAISRYLYNNVTKHDNKKIMNLYDTDNKEQDYIIDSVAFKQNIINSMSLDVQENINRVCNNILEYIGATEKQHIYNKCVAVMNELKKGITQQQIAVNLGYSRQSVAKYQNIIVCAYNTLNKKYVYDIQGHTQSIDTDKIQVDVTKKATNTDFYAVKDGMNIYKPAYNDNMVKIANKLYYKELQLDRR